MSVKILIKNVQIGNNPIKESRKSIYDEYVQVPNIGPDKIVRNIIFLIVRHDYNNNGFL